MVGLELGADDYVVKPFSAREVIARIRAVLRRTSAPAGIGDTPIEIGAVRLEPAKRTATLNGAPVELAPQGVRPARTADARGRQRRHARAPDRRGLGRELVRLDEDARRPHQHTAEEAPTAAGLIHTARGVGFRFSSPEELA